MDRRQFIRRAGGAALVLGLGAGCHSSSETVDDGSLEVPAGATGEPTRVIVIGAGFAGLAAANALATAGIDVVVLEARDRLGGRIHTAELGGQPVDLGGAFIHDPKTNPLSALARRARVPTRPLSVQGAIRRVDHFFDDAAGWLAGAAHARLRALVGGFEDAAPAIIEELGVDASVAQVVDAYLASAPAADRAVARMALETITESYTSGDLERVSVGGLVEGDGAGEEDAIAVGGYGRLIRALAEPVTVFYDTAVTSIAIERDGVHVRDARGRVHRGSHAIVTIPLGVLKSGAIEFRPGLPAPTAAAIQRLGFGQLEKVILSFDESFWSGVDPAFFARGAGPAPTWFDMTPAVGRPTLVGVCAAAAARRFAALPADAAIRAATDQLRRAFGARVPAPRAAATTQWALEPYTRGAYSYIAVGATSADVEALATPVHGRLLFAGEATSVTRLAGADGAFTSGIREAKRLLCQSAVALTV